MWRIDKYVLIFHKGGKYLQVDVVPVVLIHYIDHVKRAEVGRGAVVRKRVDLQCPFVQHRRVMS